MRRTKGFLSQRAGHATFWILTLAAAWLGVGAPAAHAGTFQGVDLDIEYWAGSGANEAVMIVDFLATGGDFYAFGYRWDGDATGYDMIQSIATAGALDYTDVDFGFGVYIDNIFYHHEAGDPDFWWAYWVGSAEEGSVEWFSPPVGMADRPLSHGAFDGWYNGFDGTQPRVPEPASAMLLAVGIGFLNRRRRKHASA